jgi:hypothetical protein
MSAKEPTSITGGAGLSVVVAVEAPGSLSASNGVIGRSVDSSLDARA